jgi:hypothetical protein
MLFKFSANHIGDCWSFWFFCFDLVWLFCGRWGLNTGPHTWEAGGILPLEPLWQPFFVLGTFKIGSWELFAQADFQMAILLISASWVARITGMSHRCLVGLLFWTKVMHKQILSNLLVKHYIAAWVVDGWFYDTFFKAKHVEAHL